MRIYILLILVLFLNIVVQASKSRLGKAVQFVVVDEKDNDKNKQKEKSPEKTEVRISPQLIGDKLYIGHLNLSGQPAEISIINIIGVSVYTGKSHTINLENLPSGLYILIIKEGDNISSTKFYKK